MEDSIKDLYFGGVPNEPDELSPDERSLVDWSNLEAGVTEDLKRLVKNQITSEETITRIREFHELSQCLSKYLSSQNAPAKLNVNREEATQGILGPISKLPLENWTSLRNAIIKRNTEIMDQNLKRRCDINFVNFNYTDTLDQYLSQVDRIDNPFLRGITYGGGIATINKKILHPNGTFAETPVVGVGRAEDIPKELPIQNSDKIFLSKLDFSKHRKDFRVPNTYKALKDSDITVIYGMSIGKSDAVYFDQIIEGMISNPHKYVIIVQFEKAYGLNLLGPDIFKEEEDIQNELIDSYALIHVNESHLDEKTKNQIRDRIFVEFDNDPSSYFPFEMKEKQETPQTSHTAN